MSQLGELCVDPLVGGYPVWQTDSLGRIPDGVAIVLRSLFRTLKCQRVVFRDPARHLPVGDLKGAPKLVYRHRRWPASTNPYLLVSQKTALDPDRLSVNIGTIRRILPRGGPWMACGRTGSSTRLSRAPNR